MKKGKGKLDNLVKYVLEEIALCGKQGAHFNSFAWKRAHIEIQWI